MTGWYKSAGKTALLVAAEKGYTEIMNLLLQNGADTEVQGE